MDPLRRCLKDMPIVAILRGITAEEAPWAFDTLAEAGFRIIEVPLNSPDALRSIRLMLQRATAGMLIGAGTVLTVEQVKQVAGTGAKLIVAPNCDSAVIEASASLGLTTLPGVATPTEAFAALKAGADGLKMFPGELLPPKAVKAWRAVMPAGTLLMPVGGITPDNMLDYVTAGADGFGIGSNLYKPGIDASELATRAQEFVSRIRDILPED